MDTHKPLSVGQVFTLSDGVSQGVVLKGGEDPLVQIIATSGIYRISGLPTLVCDSMDNPEEVEELEEFFPTPKDFLEGPVVFCVGNPSGQKYTYMSSVREDDKRPGEKIVFLRFHSGGLETFKGKPQLKFDYLGRMHPPNPVIFHSVEKSACTKDGLYFQVAQWALNLIWMGTTPPPGYSIQLTTAEPPTT